MCPQQQRRALTSLLLTSLSVNSYNPVIDQCFMIEGLAEKLVTVYQHDIEQRFSNDLLQFVDYSNDFLDYVEDGIDI